MVYASFDGREILKALRAMRYRPVGREGSHIKLRYEHPVTNEVRAVSVPLTDSEASQLAVARSNLCTFSGVVYRWREYNEAAADIAGWFRGVRFEGAPPAV